MDQQSQAHTTVDHQVYVPEYRLAPEHKFPAALEDITYCYEKLLKKYPAEKIILAGDSAGGNLVITSMLNMLERNIPLPAAGVCFSPWLDLTTTCKDAPETHSLRYNEEFDYLPVNMGAKITQAIVADNSEHYLSNPLLSPVYSKRLGELPPLLIFAGAGEVLLDDILHFVRNANEQKHTRTLLHVVPSSSHAYSLFAPYGHKAGTFSVTQLMTWLSDLFPGRKSALVPRTSPQYRLIQQLFAEKVY